MKTVSIEDALLAIYDPEKAFDQIRLEIDMHICEFFINKKFFISAFYANQVINNAKEGILDVFRNFTIIDFDKDKFLNIIVPTLTMDMSTGIIEIIEHGKAVNAEKINKIKGLFGGDTEILKIMSDSQNNDIFICHLAFHTFLYIVTKFNSIMYDTNTEFKKFFDSLEVLKKQDFPFGGVNEKYKDGFSKNYNKYVKTINKTLCEISDFRNLKISQDIKRNAYIVAINKAIHYTFENNNLLNCKTILIDSN